MQADDRAHAGLHNATRPIQKGKIAKPFSCRRVIFVKRQSTTCVRCDDMPQEVVFVLLTNLEVQSPFRSDLT